MERVLVHIRDPDGQIVSSHNATAWLGDPVFYDRFITGLLQRTGGGHTLDRSDADRAHQRLVDARAAHSVAYDEWLRGEAGLGPKVEYPLLDDYLPD